MRLIQLRTTASRANRGNSAKNSIPRTLRALGVLGLVPQHRGNPFLNLRRAWCPATPITGALQ
jgi:hypothetical protein